MGLFASSEEIENETKNVDTNGNVNNNIIISEARDTHSQLIVNEKLLFATCCQLAMEITKLVLYGITHYKKAIKKRYGSPHHATNPGPTVQKFADKIVIDCSLSC